MIRRKEIPPFVDGKDFEQELVALRMMASLHHLKGAAAFEKARGDAEWLLKNSGNQLLVNIAKGLLNSSDLVRDISTGPLSLLWTGYISPN